MFGKTCARTEGGVLIYLSKQSEDHLPRTLISHGGKLAEAAVVAAPILKLCPSIFFGIQPPLRKKEPCFFCKVFPGKKGARFIGEKGPSVSKWGPRIQVC